MMETNGGGPGGVAVGRGRAVRLPARGKSWRVWLGGRDGGLRLELRLGLHLRLIRIGSRNRGLTLIDHVWCFGLYDTHFEFFASKLFLGCE